MAKAKKGDTVKVHYTGKLNDGTVFDSSIDRGPLEFTIGDGKVIPGFETGVDGMETGEKKEIHIPSDQAYGPHRPELLIDVSKEQFPPEEEPQVGQQLQMQDNEGHIIIVSIVEINEDTIKLDANPPLAGQDLNFDLDLVEIV